MNYTLMPSLEHIALVTIATTLWNQDDIRALMSKFNFPVLYFVRRKWQEIENKVSEKVPQLSLPKSLRKEILGFIKPVGLQILKWKEYNQEINKFGKHLPNELCWTPQGTVDVKKTAKALIKDESLDVINRYKLACIYCLEDVSPELWKKIPRKSLYSEEDLSILSHWDSSQHLVVLWTDDNIREVLNHDSWWQRWCSRNQLAFHYAANKAATEYFLQKLTSGEKGEWLVKTAKEVVRRVTFDTSYMANNKADILCFLLSQMNEEQQTEVFKTYPREVLACLLEWPWQSLFMQTANRMWDFLDGCLYGLLLTEIVDKVIEGYKDYDYQKLFGEFWQQSPNALKRYVIGIKLEFLSLRLFQIKDKENIELILKDATLIEKSKLIFYRIGQEICKDLIQADEWDLLQFLIRECISSKDEMIKFKEEFEKHLPYYYYSKVELAEKKDKFFQLLLDDFMNGYNKRKSVVEGDSGPAKRLHSTE